MASKLIARLSIALLFFVSGALGFSALVYILEGSNELWFSRMVASAVILALAHIADAVQELRP